MDQVIIRIPVLNLKDVSFDQQVKKVVEEIAEVEEAVEIDHITEEVFDTLQAALGLLLKLSKFDILKANLVHNEKLHDRGWDTEGTVQIIINRR